jgi:hypothetical protein
MPVKIHIVVVYVDTVQSADYTELEAGCFSDNFIPIYKRCYNPENHNNSFN